MRIIYGLFSLIDWLVYWIASMIFRVIIDISDTPFFTDKQITEIAQRIYIIVGVLMLFKLVVSAIQYIMNPDSFDDKEKGLFGLLKNMLITIVLMVIVPVIFDFAKDIQDKIVVAIPKIILGSDSVSYEDKDDIDQQMNKTGTELSYTVLSSFLREQNGGTVGTYCPYDSTSACQSYCALDDKSKCKTGEIHNLDTFLAHAAGGCPLLFGDTKSCKYDYMIIISTLCGGFLVYVLLSMALDVAIRTIKLGLIRMLAPIPITSYMFGKDKFNKFVKTAFQVYADLFIRMAIIYFIVFAIQSLVRTGILDPLNLGGNGIADTGNWFRNTIVNIVLIFGLLMFAKTAPKFLSELLGLPDIGSGEMAEMFKPAWQRAGGAAVIGGTFGAGLANMANKISQGPGNSFGQKLKNTLLNKQARRDMWKSGIGGAASAGFHSAIAAAQGKNFKDVNAAGYRRAIKARQNRDLDRLNGVGWRDRLKVSATDYMGLDTKASLAESKQKAYSTLHQDVGAFKKAVMGRIIKNGDVSMRVDLKEHSAIDQLGKLLNDNSATIVASGNADLVKFLNKFELKNWTDSAGNSHTAWGLKSGESISYHDIAAINADATQAGIGSIAGVTGENGALTLLAQKELFTDAMAGRVRRTDGTLMDEINVNSGNTHVDIATTFQTANQHLAENSVQLGESASALQEWFSGRVTDSSSPHYGKDFNNMDDTYQRKSAELSGEMSTGSTGTEARARASLERRNANKDGK